jgi:hypothetical protein
MSAINNKNYDSLLSRLDQMSSGIKKNAKNPKVASTLNEKTYNEAKQNLEKLRNQYLQAQAAARKAYDMFEENLKDAHLLYAGDVRIVKGIFGRTAEDLAEFGISPEKAERKKREKPVA